MVERPDPGLPPVRVEESVVAEVHCVLHVPDLTHAISGQTFLLAVVAAPIA